MGKLGKQCQTLFWGAPKSLQMVIAAMKLKDTYTLEGKLWPTDSILKSRDITLPTTGPSNQGYGFSSSHVSMWELDYKESSAPKNCCFWTVVLGKTLESPLDCKEIQPVHPKGDQSWVFIGRTDAEAETPIHWPLDAETHLKRPCCWERLRAGREGDDRRWDGWMASPTQWKWVWVNSGSWWWAGRPGVLWFMGSQRVRQDWATELNWTEYLNYTSWNYKSLTVFICRFPLAFKTKQNKNVTDSLICYHVHQALIFLCSSP